jgi:SAM-dependent methyltransferase
MTRDVRPPLKSEREPHFDSLVDLYDRYRTGYPRALFERVLREVVGRPRVLDLATGTGLAARDLAPAASRLVACDIAPRMIERSRWGLRVLARAEALPFVGGAFDLVTCAQAFHWMDAERAYAEVRRVLAPRGVAAFWWKYEEPDDPTAKVADAVYERVTGKPAPETKLERSPLPDLPPGLFASREEIVLRFPMRLTIEAYVGYHASRENLRRDAGVLRQRVLNDMRRSLDAMHPTGVCDIAYFARLEILRAGARP